MHTHSSTGRSVAIERHRFGRRRDANRTRQYSFVCCSCFWTESNPASVVASTTTTTHVIITSSSFVDGRWVPFTLPRSPQARLDRAAAIGDLNDALGRLRFLDDKRKEVRFPGCFVGVSFSVRDFFLYSFCSNVFLGASKHTVVGSTQTHKKLVFVDFSSNENALFFVVLFVGNRSRFFFFKKKFYKLYIVIFSICHDLF